MIKYGLKLWSSDKPELFDKAKRLIERKIFHFIELYIVPFDCSLSKLGVIKGLTVSIHATHELHGFNFAQKKTTNFTILNQVYKVADLFGAKIIVVHPGIEGSLKTVTTNLKRIHDKRVIIENMPFKALPSLGEKTCVGSTLKEIQAFQNLGFKLCIDFGHAIKSSMSQSIHYKDFIRQLLSFKPSYFHISDISFDNEHDEHLNLGEGDIDLAWIKHELLQLPQAKVVLETPKNANDLLNDKQNIEFFRRI